MAWDTSKAKQLSSRLRQTPPYTNSWPLRSGPQSAPMPICLGRLLQLPYKKNPAHCLRTFPITQIHEKTFHPVCKRISRDSIFRISLLKSAWGHTCDGQADPPFLLPFSQCPSPTLLNKRPTSHPSRICHWCTALGTKNVLGIKQRDNFTFGLALTMQITLTTVSNSLFSPKLLRDLWVPSADH